jgi:hypothetical protein
LDKYLAYAIALKPAWIKALRKIHSGHLEISGLPRTLPGFLAAAPQGVKMGHVGIVHGSVEPFSANGAWWAGG